MSRTSKILRRAGEIIMEKGLAYGKSHDNEARRCMMGALFDASGEVLDWKALEATDLYLMRVYGPEYTHLADLNDKVLLQDGKVKRKRAKVEAACLFYEAAAYADSQGL